MHRFLFSLLAMLFVVSSSGFAIAATQAGKVVGISGSAEATGKQGKRSLRVESAIYSGDRIKTKDGEVQIRFKDDTRLAIGKNSTVVIDSFVFSNKSTAQKFAVQAARGALRFISGNSDKSAYTIRTRNSTIGIRGTAFDVAAGQTTRVMLFNGRVQVCRSSTDCKNLREQCELAQVAPRTSVDKGVHTDLNRRILVSAFPYVTDEDRLPKDFRVGAGACERGVGAGGPASGGGGGSAASGKGRGGSND